MGGSNVDDGRTVCNFEARCQIMNSKDKYNDISSVS